ncbi:hypothetical protein [Nocardioides sp. TF02-7]|uniref:hypothetical protein n=1 Tax=Nocardioides sp. TF02-7 TaxID=2917724 RepID=UPI001F050F00|nr:hypothetical protein [Nocardioides sp. TF02-7]UMG91484.1 hypothetical protein MF408_15310 [Nocardioides sp. TF02-7]
MWERLLEFLDEWATVTEVEPGRLRVVVDGADGTLRVVEILMSRQEWDDMVSIPFGDFAPAADEVRRAVLALTDDQRYLVYENYELVPSTTPVLPVDPEEERLAELARRHPEGFGRWVAIDWDGNVVDELGPPRS